MPVHSFGDPNAQPPTPKETPTSATFPSPAFETPKPNQSSFEDSSGWTPRFAEEYSVFNSTPGNLRGTDGPFPDYTVSTPYLSSGHKRLHSAETIAAEIAAHVNHFSPNPNLPLPPVDPARRLQSSPTALPAGPSPTNADFQSSAHQEEAKKVRQGTLAEDEAQTATPPPSGRRGERRLAPKLQTGNMQNDEFEHEFVAVTPHQQQQQHHMANFVTTPIDMFGVPLSAPASAPVFTDSRSFWDADMSGMDLDFTTPVANMFPMPGHRPMNSLDWGKSNEIFQQTGALPQPAAQPQLPPPSQDNRSLPKKERALAPKPPKPNVDTSMVDMSMFGASFPTPVDDPFGMISQAPGVDPGLLFTQPPSLGMEPATFDPMTQQPLMPGLLAPQPLRIPVTEMKRGQVRRSNSTKEIGKGKRIDRASASSPVKSSSRPGLSRSFSENRGRKQISRAANLPSLAPAVRPSSQSSSGSRGSGRTSPMKHHNRLSSLTSIPEASPPRPRTSVKFTIDARGRARAETTVIMDDNNETPRALPRRRNRSSRSRSWDTSDDESSTDDEPIIIPSRNTSFAMPEPRKPALASSVQSSQRSFSEQNASSLGIFFNEPGASQNDPESEAETLVDAPTAISNSNSNSGSSRGDAASELRKVREHRQKKVAALNTSHRLLSGPPYSAGSTISPTAFTDSEATSSTDRDTPIRRIIGNANTGISENCENWLHGKCVNITRQTLPRVYLCAFCLNTPNAHGMRGREVRRALGGGNPRLSATSPLAHKSFK
ncbi:hypothetical protein F5Y15DRAFT_407862 [Xylariaceae sp. FL0016]|nr:hypothetical protein F5Y15DRAFT_407862 [Xylariaceae sp. FL0016]